MRPVDPRVDLSRRVRSRTGHDEYPPPKHAATAYRGEKIADRRGDTRRHPRVAVANLGVTRRAGHRAVDGQPRDRGANPTSQHHRPVRNGAALWSLRRHCRDQPSATTYQNSAIAGPASLRPRVVTDHRALMDEVRPPNDQQDRHGRVAVPSWLRQVKRCPRRAPDPRGPTVDP